MRKLIIRNAQGHTEMDLDTEAAIQELERLMNEGMLAVAVKGADSTHALEPSDPAIREAEEVRLFWPLAGG